MAYILGYNIYKKTHYGLIGVVRRFQQLFISRPVHLFMCVLAISHQCFIQHSWKTNDACQSDLSQASKRILAELRFELNVQC